MYRENKIHFNSTIKRLSDRLFGVGCLQDHMMITRALSAKKKKVLCFSFLFTGLDIKRYTMEYIFSIVTIGEFNDTLKYCRLTLFEGRDENTLMRLIEDYNLIVGSEYAITLVAVDDSLPPILPYGKYPNNAVDAKYIADTQGIYPALRTWTNPSPGRSASETHKHALQLAEDGIQSAVMGV